MKSKYHCTKSGQLPKREAAAALNLDFSSSKEPKEESIASFRSAEGPFELEGLVITFQKKV